MALGGQPVAASEPVHIGSVAIADDFAVLRILHHDHHDMRARGNGQRRRRADGQRASGGGGAAAAEQDCAERERGRGEEEENPLSERRHNWILACAAGMVGTCRLQTTSTRHG